LFKARIHLTHGSLTDRGWRWRRRDAIYDLLGMRIILREGGEQAGASRMFSSPNMLKMSIND